MGAARGAGTAGSRSTDRLPDPPTMPKHARELPSNWPADWPFRPHAPLVSAAHAMVVTTDRYASQVGVDILRRGGNAVDAAVAVSFALAVVNPEAGNIGGGGFLVLRMADGTAAAQDHRTRAPLGASRDMFLDDRGEVSERATIGHLAAAVPGTVMGLWDAHRRFGTLGWDELVEPAVGLAAQGFQVTERFLRSFTPQVVAGLARFPASAALFLPGGRPHGLGHSLHMPDLARTLEWIRDLGPDGFYRGETADRIVEEMAREGGIITHADLASYAALWRDPVRARYRGYALLSMAPSSSGGATLAEIGNILEGFPIGNLPWHGSRHVHLLAEAARRAYADRNHYLTDPDFAAMPLRTLTSPDYGVWRARDISLEAATPSAQVAPAAETYRAEGQHTTHLSILDEAGNAVSLTTTINSWYGAKVVVGGTGIVLNNDMDDFTTKVGVPNQFGLVQGEANAIAPGKRMLSAMTPTIMLDEGERVSVVIGTPGGSAIITTVFQVLSNLVDHGMDLAQAVLAPRVHHQHLPDQIWYEPGGLPVAVLETLAALGHRVVEREDFAGDVQAILVLPDGTLEGVSDPRRGGVALGY